MGNVCKAILRVALQPRGSCTWFGCRAAGSKCKYKVIEVLLLGAQLRVRVAKSGQIPDLDSNLN